MYKVNIDRKQKGSVIDKKLHGQFIEFLGTCVSGGIWVGEESDIPNYGGLRKDIVDALQKLQPPVVRWPGGCFADMYHWRDGIGPKEKRPVTYNNNFGTGSLENNHFGTHEFMRFCRMVGAEPWININMMSGSAAEMQEWVSYCNGPEGTSLSEERKRNGSAEPFNVKYWGIGNESWAGGGTYTAQSYANEYRKFTAAFPRFSGFVPKDGDPPEPVFIAVGPDGNKPQERVRWTQDFCGALTEYRAPQMDGYDLHFYNWNLQNAEDTIIDFDRDAWYSVLLGCGELEYIICEQHELMRKAINALSHPPDMFGGAARPECGLIIGEWGNWHRMDADAPSALWQQCTMRDAITTALTLDIFHRHSDKLYMACVAQTVNVLNSLILTFGEKTILTPNYYIFDMYKVHRQATPLSCCVETDTLYTDERGEVKGLYVFASQKGENMYINVINASYDSPCEAVLDMGCETKYKSGLCMGGVEPNAFNTPETPQAVIPVEAAAPEYRSGGWRCSIPKASVTVYHFEAL